VAGVVLLVPIVYLVIALSQIQSAVLAAEGGARHAARLFAEASTPSDAIERAEAAVTLAFADQSIDDSSVRVDITCERGRGEVCLERDSVVTVTVRMETRLPLAPPILGIDDAAVVPIEARGVNAVSAFWRGEEP
jgi:Flp pilus assembly protein TadG